MGIQILAEGPADSVMHPEVSSDPGTRKDHWILRRPEVPVDGRASKVAKEEAAAAVLVAGVQEGPAAQNAKTAVPQSR
jgi:hypothetical protein